MIKLNLSLHGARTLGVSSSLTIGKTFTGPGSGMKLARLRLLSVMYSSIAYPVFHPE